MYITQNNPHVIDTLILYSYMELINWMRNATSTQLYTDTDIQFSLL